MKIKRDRTQGGKGGKVFYPDKVEKEKAKGLALARPMAILLIYKKLVS